MEEALANLLNSGNATSIICATVVYLIIHYQRRNTGSERDAEFSNLQMELALLKQRLDSVENVTDILSQKMDRIIEGINELNIQIAKLTEKSRNL